MEEENVSPKRFRKSVPVAILFLVALALPLFFNVYIFHHGQGVAFALTSYLASAALTLGVLALSCRIRTLGLICLPVIMACVLGCWYVYLVTGTFISGSVVASILETDWNEASPYLTFGNISFAVIALALIIGGILVGHKAIAPRTLWIIIGASLVAFGVFTAMAYPLGKQWQKDNMNFVGYKRVTHGMMWPVYDVRTLYRDIREYYRCAPQLYEGIMQLPSGYAPAPDDAQAAEDDVLVVFMLGESVRASNLQINGYAKETTPGLAEWMGKGQLVTFRNTCSFGVLTRISSIGMLTDAELETRTPHHRPWFDMLDKDGVDTSAVMAVFGAADSRLARLVQDCRHPYEIDPSLITDNRVHGETIVQFRKALAEHGAASRAFFLLYDTGAHGPYVSLPENKKFLPDDVVHGKGADPVKLQNSYDNALLEVDWELSEIMAILEKTGRPAVFVFASDHGDALGENGVYFHGILEESVYRPAMFVWFSTAYMEKYPERCGIVKSHAEKAVSHDHIMHTILSLCGVRRGAYKAELDLTQPEIRETPVPQDLPKLEQVFLPGEEGAQ